METSDAPSNVGTVDDYKPNPLIIKQPLRQISSGDTDADSAQIVDRNSFKSTDTPSKPTSTPPPVPCAPAVVDIPPPKPPRASAIAAAAASKSLAQPAALTESYNAYDVDDAASAKQSVPPAQTRMRHPVGWEVQTDSDGSSFYTHPDSSDQWVCAKAEDGQVYYYEKNSRLSTWNLPPLEQQQPTSAAQPSINTTTACSPSSTQRPMSSFNDRPSNPFGSVGTSSINTIDLSEAQAKFGARKMSNSRSGDDLSGSAAQEDSSSRFYRVTKEHITGPIENKIRATERRGRVCRTLYSTNGVRVPKKWVASVFILSGPVLYIYKDSKGQFCASPDPRTNCSASPKSSSAGQRNSDSCGSGCGNKFFSFRSKGSGISGKPEFEIHVNHLQVFPVDKSYTSREHVFLLKDLTDPDNITEHLIETGSLELRKAWETALVYSQELVNENRFHAGAFSTSPPPSVDQKVIVMLREFFRKRPPVDAIRASGILRNEPVFGSNLMELCEKDQSKVPAFVARVIGAIEARGLDAIGIYRKSGNGGVIQKLRNQVNHSEYSLNSNEWDIYELSDSLKLFLRELKEPLLSHALYKDLLDFSASMPHYSTEDNIKRMRAILAELPDCHYGTTKALLGHLNKVAAVSHANQMHSKNLAIVFGPNIMWPDSPTTDYERFSVASCSCTEFLIANYATIFAPN